MQWVAASEKDTANGTLQKRLWEAADVFRANSGIRSQESVVKALISMMEPFKEECSIPPKDRAPLKLF